jgi:transposase
MATRAEWAERVARWQASGQSAKAFAARERIDAKRLGWWRWRLGASPSLASERAPRFVEMQVIGAAPAGAPEGGPVEIALPNGRVVRVAPGFDAVTLERVLTIASGEGGAC